MYLLLCLSLTAAPGYDRCAPIAKKKRATLTADYYNSYTSIHGFLGQLSDSGVSISSTVPRNSTRSTPPPGTRLRLPFLSPRLGCIDLDVLLGSAFVDHLPLETFEIVVLVTTL